jgi:TRAP-type C4-dicarboxylate transport system substrate-binding protein
MSNLNHKEVNMKGDRSLQKIRGMFALSTLALIFAFLVFSPISSAETKELSFGVFAGSEHYHTKAMTAWAKDVEASTGGQIRINFYPGGTLSKGPQAYNAVIKDIQDISTAANGWTKGRFPFTRVVDLPLGMKTSVQASLATWDFYKKFKPKEWDEVKVLYLINHGHAFFHTKNEVRRVEDLKGMRIRCTGNDAPVVSLTGAVPVGMPMSESYIALQKGIVDGILCNFGAMDGWKLAEVTKYHLDVPVVGCAFWIAMNLDVWNSLSPEIQKAIDNVSEKHVSLTGQAWEDSDTAGRNFAKKLGNQIISLPPNEAERFQKVFDPILEGYVNDMKAKGLPGREALDYMTLTIKKYDGR